MSYSQKSNQGKITHRDGNIQSKSPDDLNNERGLLQRIQMKNFAFIPGKNQFSMQPNTQMQSCNITNVKCQNNDNEQQLVQQTKLSPQRLIGASGNKMIIPANQIKLVKKDASPSPDSRQGPILQMNPTSITFVNKNNLQNVNPNVLSQTNRNLQHPQKQSSKVFSNNHQILSNQLSDDETNVNSDNEERVSNLSQLKTETNLNNFNRPKLSTNKASSNIVSNSNFTDQTLLQQKTHRGNGMHQKAPDSQRIKVISHNKIRNSPSPPQNQVLKIIKSPQVNNIPTQNKKPIDQQTQKTQLATDFIKGMINQSKTNNQNSTQKKILGNGIQNCLVKSVNNQQSFAKDMKKHGLTKDVQDISSFSQMLSENSPQRQEENVNNGKQEVHQNNLFSNKAQHMRNYSPPPYYDQKGPANIHVVILNSHNNNNKTSPQDNSPSNTSNLNEDQQQTTQGEEGSVYQFPFQRRARSLSLSKQEIIQSKLGPKPTQANPTSTDKTSQSPHRPQDNQDSRRNKPVVAKVNFMMGQKGFVKQNDNVFERNKEVDEWLMGSGESDATAGSNNSNRMNKGVASVANKNIGQQTQRKQQNDLEKPTKPVNIIEEDDNLAGDEDIEDWMFKTFDKVKGGKKDVKNAISTNRQLDSHREFEEEFGDNPFDMAPEMQKQFSKPSQQKQNQTSHYEDLSQYIDQIDQFMENSH